ncbi:hypothetical protein CEXT_693791 [Caerostris extrusa]|uniref:Uncharacterized protein n=1 Tax=Caerostris extrusa TaxID=172846 RepID=A0AAV4XZI7_CAEEX|nr:hypothetical protein CEXT_693791 [Caerostris extrusa]
MDGYIYPHFFPLKKNAYLNMCGLIVCFPRFPRDGFDSQDDDDDDDGDDDNDEHASFLKGSERWLIENFNSLLWPYSRLGKG